MTDQSKAVTCRGPDGRTAYHGRFNVRGDWLTVRNADCEPIIYNTPQDARAAADWVGAAFRLALGASVPPAPKNPPAGSAGPAIDNPREHARRLGAFVFWSMGSAYWCKGSAPHPDMREWSHGFDTLDDAARDAVERLGA